MTFYVLKNERTGAYVADVRVTGGSSFTTDLRKAKTFLTRESAQRDACGDEQVCEIQHELQPPS